MSLYGDEEADHRVKSLLAATRLGDRESVLALLDAGVPINSRNRIGWTSLMIAVAGGHTDLIAALLTRGADLELINSYHYTALTLAVIRNSSGRKQTPDRGPLDLLLAAGARYGLYDAVLIDDVNLARQRLEEGASPNTAEWSYHGPLLKVAAEAGQLAIVNLLLDFGANIEATDDLGRRPLLSAANNGRIEVVRRLLARGAELDAVSWSGQSALDEAAVGGHLDLHAFLLGQGARRGITEALYLGDERLLSQLLDEAGIGGDRELDGRSDGRHSLAMIAVRRGDLAIVRLLLDRGARHAHPIFHDHTLLAEAVRHGHLEVARLLLDRDADLHEVCRDGLTPLAWAIQENQAAAADLLRQAGATH